MMILNQFGLHGSREPLLSAQTFALEHLITIHCVTTDLRWAMVELALRSFTAMLAFAQGQFVLLARRMVRREGPFRLGHHRC
jgi:hypothetical protein